MLLSYHSCVLLHTAAAALLGKGKYYYIGSAAGFVLFSHAGLAAFPPPCCGCKGRHIEKRNIRKPHELTDKIFADVTQSDRSERNK